MFLDTYDIHTHTYTHTVYDGGVDCGEYVVGSVEWEVGSGKWEEGSGDGATTARIDSARMNGTHRRRT
jgi:hypothetical protein